MNSRRSYEQSNDVFGSVCVTHEAKRRRPCVVCTGFAIRACYGSCGGQQLEAQRAASSVGARAQGLRELGEHSGGNEGSNGNKKGE